jgi:hypothetical protein
MGLGGGEREIRKHDRACNHSPNAYYRDLLTLQDGWVALFLYLQALGGLLIANDGEWRRLRNCDVCVEMSLPQNSTWASARRAMLLGSWLLNMDSLLPILSP